MAKVAKKRASKRTAKTAGKRKKPAAKATRTRKSGARAMWKGVVKMGRTEVPVKLYSAVQGQDVGFRLLHQPDKQPVQQVMINPETDDVVPYERIKKAFPDGDVLVILNEDELASLKPEPSRDIEVMRFVDADDITQQWYDRPYYLGPDGSNGDYFALAEALKRSEKQGVVRWVMRNQEYVGALLPAGDHLMLITLRHAEEVIPVTALEPPVGRTPDQRELKLARQLVAALESDFDPAEFKDEHRERLLEFIEKKAKGRAPKVSKIQAKRATPKDNLASVLEASLKSTAKERRSA
ncbi:MAG: Ku protein [Gemmatimonadota bacterium]